MNAAELATLALVQSIAVGGTNLWFHPDLNFGIVTRFDLLAALRTADTCRDDGAGLFTVFATDDDGVRLGVQVRFKSAGDLLVLGMGQVGDEG